MRTSTDRILTTHCGSLPRPDDVIAMYASDASADEIAPRVSAAVGDVVREQRDAGIDVVNDGEFGKPMRAAIDYAAWNTYMHDRIEGFEMVPTDMSHFGTIGKDRHDFATYYGSADDMLAEIPPTMPWPVARGPLRYVGQEAMQRNIDDFRVALKDVGAAEGFMAAVSPTSIECLQRNEYFATDDDYQQALADVLRVEYELIANAGFVLQIDDPAVAVCYDWWFAGQKSREEYRKWAERRVEVLNYALEGVPEEQVRYHLCWGSWHGPHSADVPLAEIVDLILKVKARAISLEAANVRHEHEWKVWQDVKLPDGKILVPGVVSHATNVLEHPDLVADRICRYAELVGRENVIASTDCGLGGRIHPQLAWAKLRALSEGAEIATRRLWG